MSRYFFRRFIKLLCTSLLVLVAVASTQCKRSGSGNDLNFISGSDPQSCQQVDAARVAQVTSAMRGLFNGSSDQNELTLAMNLLAALPDPYLNHLVKAQENRNFQISFVDVVTSCGGSTQVDANGNKTTSYDGIGGCTSLAYIPTFSHVLRGQVAHALIHELGHGLRYFIAQNGSLSNDSSAFDEGLSSVYQSEGLSSAYVGSYAKGTLEEYFAEAFQSFYCSAQTNGEMQSQLPQTYAFLQKVLLPPTWGSGSPSTPGILAQANPNSSNQFSSGIPYNGSGSQANPGIASNGNYFGSFGASGFSCGIVQGMGLSPVLMSTLLTQFSAAKQTLNQYQCADMLKMAISSKQVGSNTSLTLESNLTTASLAGVTLCIGDAGTCANSTATRFSTVKSGKGFTTQDIPAATVALIKAKPVVTLEGQLMVPAPTQQLIPFKCESSVNL